MSVLRVFVFPSSPFLELKKVDYRVCLEYHTEKIIPNSSEMKRLKIALFERKRVCDFSFMSLEFVNFRSLDIRVNTVFYFPYFNLLILMLQAYLLFSICG